MGSVFWHEIQIQTQFSENKLLETKANSIKLISTFQVNKRVNFKGGHLKDVSLKMI